MKYLVLLMLIGCQAACAAPREVDEFHWVDVDRIVAIGDIHGDYANYIATLQLAGLITSRGKWAGGETHLVQTGDIPDRGDDTVKIIEHLQKLTKEAIRKGGRVHSLIGNHEVMNIYGDLRYVTAGEFKAFESRNSPGLRDRYFDLVIQNIQKTDPAGFASLPENYRELWDQDHPLGWLEHRQAWNSGWNPKAELVEWVLGNKVAIQINDTVFLHGGISGFYCQNSLESLTAMVVKNLQEFDPAAPGILEDDFGPLWYRGLSGGESPAAPETVQAILDRHHAQRIVVGHTPTSGVIWPRYDGKVIQIDSGISAAYGGYIAFLEINHAGVFAGYPKGKIELPADESGLIPYLNEVISGDPENPYLQKMLKELKNPESETTKAEAESGAETGAKIEAEVGADAINETENAPGVNSGLHQLAEADETPKVQPRVAPICGISE